MQDLLVLVVNVGAGLAALLGLTTSLLRRPVGTVLLVGSALLELVVLVQTGFVVVGLVQGATIAGGTAVFLAYVVFAVVVLPVGVLWALGEPNRWSGTVVAVAALALLVTTVRMDTVWLGGLAAAGG